MKNAKTDAKSEKSVDLFLENENSVENQPLSRINDSDILQNRETENFTKKFRPFFNLLKQVFFFLPGTLFLYLIGFVGTIVLIDSFSAREPMEIFGIASAPLQFIIFGIIVLFGTFMTWFGLGDIKNRKHIAIPTSILLTGGILAAIFKILSGVLGFTGLFEFLNYYFIYLFPLVLIVPILVKGWIDQKPES